LASWRDHSLPPCLAVWHLGTGIQINITTVLHQHVRSSSRIEWCTSICFETKLQTKNGCDILPCSGAVPGLRRVSVKHSTNDVALIKRVNLQQSSQQHLFYKLVVGFLVKVLIHLSRA